jgi:hypothetical protein
MPLSSTILTDFKSVNPCLRKIHFAPFQGKPLKHTSTPCIREGSHDFQDSGDALIDFIHFTPGALRLSTFLPPSLRSPPALSPPFSPSLSTLFRIPFRRLRALTPEQRSTLAICLVVFRLTPSAIGAILGPDRRFDGIQNTS